MAVRKPIKLLLILLVIVLLVILGILMNLLILPVEMITTTTTVFIVPTTTTIKETITTTLTTTTPIIIYKSYCKGNKCWLYEGESLDIVEDDIEYTIRLVGVTDKDTAVIEVDGETESFDQNEDKKVKGLGVYLMEVFYLPKEGQVSFVQFQVY